MIQKRTNPLDDKKMEEKATPAYVSGNMEHEAVKPIQRRSNPLKLEAVSEPAPAPVAQKPVAQKPVVQKPVAQKPVAEKPVAPVLPSRITGLPKKSLVLFAKVNKALYQTIIEATGNKSGKVFDDAMLCYLAVRFPEELQKAKKLLKEEGCDIK